MWAWTSRNWGDDEESEKEDINSRKTAGERIIRKTPNYPSVSFFSRQQQTGKAAAPSQMPSHGSEEMICVTQ